MGTLVLSTATHDTAPNYAVTAPLAAAVVVGDGELGVFIGANLTDRVEAYDGILRCLHALREAHWPNPVTTELSAAMYTVGTHTLAVSNGAAPVLTENAVAVLRGLDYAPAGSSSSAHVRRMAGTYLEAKKAA